MIRNGLSSIAEGEARDVFKQYLSERNLNIDPDQLFDHVISRTNILSIDHDDGIVFFTHRSFGEFLFAKRMVQKKHLEIDGRAFDLYWMNTYFFYVGLHKDCPDILKEILGLKTTDASESWRKLINIPNYLLAGFLSPYSVVEDNFYKLFLEAARLFLAIRNGDVQSNISHLSEMQALWIVQFALRHSYAYEYFASVIDTAAVQVYEEIESDEVKAYALFFLSVVGIELGVKDPFDCLLSEYQAGNIPLAISWAIECEARAQSDIRRSSLMKKHGKKLKKLTKDNRSLVDQINNLFDQPMVAKTRDG